MDIIKRDGLTDFEAYAKLVNCLDAIALGTTTYENEKRLINSISLVHSFYPEDVGDANDAYGHTWLEVIEGFKENYRTGNRQ